MLEKKIDRYSAHLVLVLAPPLLLVMSSAAWAQALGDVPAGSAAGAVGGLSRARQEHASARRTPARGPCRAPSRRRTSRPRRGWIWRSPTSAISNGSTSTVPLTGLELDLYLISTAVAARRADARRRPRQRHGQRSRRQGLRYGMLGVSAALQLPLRLAPFIQGNLAAGVLQGSLRRRAVDPRHVGLAQRYQRRRPGFTRAAPMSAFTCTRSAACT